MRGGAGTSAVLGQARVQEARRRRLRNALVHGIPANFAIVESAHQYAEFLSDSALNFALESYVEGTTPAAVLAKRTDEFTAVQTGQDAASYWRARITCEVATSTGLLP